MLHLLLPLISALCSVQLARSRDLYCVCRRPGGFPWQSLSSKVALITGGISGLGYATALRFARNGASVVMLDVAAPGDVKVSVPGGIYVQADVRSEEEVSDC